MRLTVGNRTMTVFPPKGFVPQDGDGDAPPVRLELSRVLGYRSKNIRNNLFELPTGETLYSVGPWCVLLQANGSHKTYAEHTADVRCMALHPDSTTVASGQTHGPQQPETAHVRIWSASTLQTGQVLGNGIIQRAVCCLAFSPADPSLLVTVDDGPQHMIVLWSWEPGTPLAQCKGHTDQIAAAAFNPATYQLVTCGRQHINFWTLTPVPDTPGRVQLVRKAGLFQAFVKAKMLSCLCFSPSGDTVTGDSNGTIYAWGPAVPSHLITNTIREAHKGGVAALAATTHGFLSAGTVDGRVRVWAFNYQPYPVQNSEVNTIVIDHPIRTIAPAATAAGLSLSQFTVGTCENSIFNADAKNGSAIPVLLGPPGAVISAASLPPYYLTATDELLLAWHSETDQLAWTWAASGAGEDAQIVSVDAGRTPDGTAIVMVGLTVAIALLSESGKAIGIFPEAQTVTLARLSPCATMIAVGLSDSVIAIRRLAGPDEPEPHVVCRGLQAALASIDWTRDSTALRASSASYELQTWSVDSGEALLAADAAALLFATNTARVGWPCIGVMHAASTATVADSVGNILVTGDENGELRAYKYPSYKPNARSVVSKGHGATIDVVRFLSDSLILSSSTQNAIVCLWRMVSREGAAAASATTANALAPATATTSLTSDVDRLPMTREESGSSLMASGAASSAFLRDNSQASMGSVGSGMSAGSSGDGSAPG